MTLGTVRKPNLRELLAVLPIFAPLTRHACCFSQRMNEGAEYEIKKTNALNSETIANIKAKSRFFRIGPRFNRIRNLSRASRTSFHHRGSLCWIGHLEKNDGGKKQNSTKGRSSHQPATLIKYNCRGQVVLEGLLAICLIISSMIALLSIFSHYIHRAAMEFVVENNAIAGISAGRISPNSLRQKNRKLELNTRYRRQNENFIRY